MSVDSGGGGGTGGAGGAGGSFVPPLGDFEWQDDTVTRDATTATASLVTSSGIQSLHVAGREPGGTGVAFDISAMPTIMTIPYNCETNGGGPYPVTSFTYTANGVDQLFDMCTISITNFDTTAGHISGSFSAVLTNAGNIVKGITLGDINIPMTVSP